MDKMLVAVFDTENAAYKGLDALSELNDYGDITLYATAVVVRDPSGDVRVVQSAEGPIGTAVGTLTGGLVGLLGGPMAVAVGAAVGATTGLFADVSRSGVSQGFLDDVTAALAPGKVALLAEMEETWEAPVDAKLSELGAVVFRFLRSDVVDDQLAQVSAAYKVALQDLKDDMARERAENKAAVQKQIDNINKKLEATQAQAREKADQLNKEREAKIDAIREQMKQANDAQKAKMQKRIDEINKDYEARRAKLDQTQERIKETLAA